MQFQRLEDLRIDADKTQAEIAEVLSCKREVYRRYEKGIRENARAVQEAFAWNKGFKEFFAVKACPNPF